MGMDICLLANEIDGIFTLPCALCADHIILPEVIHTLAAVDRMVICGSQGIGDVLLVSDAVPAVLWLAVYGISRDADHRFLLHQRYIIAARPIGSRHKHSTSASRNAATHLIICFKTNLPFSNLNIRKRPSTRAFQRVEKSFRPAA